MTPHSEPKHYWHELTEQEKQFVLNVRAIVERIATKASELPPVESQQFVAAEIDRIMADFASTSEWFASRIGRHLSNAIRKRLAH